MKNMKKMFALMLAVLMLCACITANAATITVEGDNDSAEYNIYLLLNATVDPTDDKKIAYSINEKYKEVLEAFFGTGVDPVAQLAGFGADSAELNNFAKDIYAAITAKGIEADATATGSTPSEDVDPGYVLIAETSLGEDSADTYSLHVLHTVKGNDIVINTKEEAPTLVKKLKEKNDTTGEETDWQDGADYDVKDDVPFQLTGTLSNRYENYETYYYQFEDEICQGLTFNQDSVKVYVYNDAASTEVTSAFTTVKTDKGFTVTCTDLKKIANVDINADSQIVVEYTATLNEQSLIGSQGNPNQAKLKYNNNPYYDGTGDPSSGDNTSETPWDKVIVFTYQLKVTKVDEAGNKLTGATFELYKIVNDGNGETQQLVKQIVGTDSSEFLFERLDAGKYILKETKTPDGYNPIADIEFTVKATYDEEEADPLFGELSVVSTSEMNADSTSGTIETEVENKAGATLPETGGIGTTIFYIAGGVLVLLAVVLLVTKRRMGENN